MFLMKKFSMVSEKQNILSKSNSSKFKMKRNKTTSSTKKFTTPKKIEMNLSLKKLT